MSNPTLWLDYIVGVICVVGVALSIITACTNVSPRKGKLRLAVFACFAAVAILGGFDNLLTRKQAARYQSTGVLSAVRVSGGRNPSSELIVRTPSNELIHLHFRSTSHLLETGEQIRVTWIIYSGEAVHIDVLSGLGAGSELEAGTAQAWFNIVAGLLFAGMGYFGWKKNPNGEATRSQTENLSSSYVDEESMLNLNQS